MDPTKEGFPKKLNGHQPMSGSEHKMAHEPDPSDWKRELRDILKSKAVAYAVAALAGLVALRLAVNRLERRQGAVIAPTVQVAHPQLRGLDRTLSLPGDIEAIEEARLYAHVSGYLKKIYADEGDSVKAGQLLADIDAPDIVQEYNKAKADDDFKNETLKRYKELLKAQVVSEQEYDDLAAAAEEANARLQNAQANMDYTKIRAPFSGGIARRYVYPGDLISEATKGGNQPPIFLLVNENRLRVSINVPQNETGQIHIGDLVDIAVDSLPGTVFHGAISRVDALLDEATKTQRVLIDIENPDRKLRAGMFASIILHLQHVDNALTLPKDAIQGVGDNSFVYTVVDGKARQQRVKVGLTDLTYAQVTGGLDASSVVIVAGGQSLTDGTTVLTVVADGGAR